MRRGVIGFVLLGSLAAIGSQFAHSLAYRLVVSDADARVRTVAAAQHRYLEYAPLGLAVCSAVIVLGFAAQVRAHVRRSPGVGRPAPVAYALFAPLLFCFQELLERLAAQG